MAEVNERVEAELENIEHVVAELSGCNSMSKLSSLELGGVAALIHNFYNGIENILKQIIKSSGSEVGDSASWHRDLVNLAASKGIVSETTATELRRYLAFRHFFSHGYSFDLDKERIVPIVDNVQQTLALFKKDITNALKKM